MTRKKYEKKQDRKNELDVITIFCKKYKLSFKKLSDEERIDYALYRKNKLRMYVEIKCRNYVYDEWKYLILSNHKWLAGKDLSKKHNVPFCVLYKFSDGKIFLCNSNNSHYQNPPINKNGGRTVLTRDELDIEPVVELDRNYFKQIIF